MLVAALLILFSIFAGSALPAGRQVFAQVQNPTPLRPYPNQFTEEEASKTLNPTSPDPSLTIYCAQRPPAVQNNAIDKRQPTVTLQVQGNLSADFSRFITPFLSITDTSKPDASLSDLDKSKQYLADYLEGRAYYEGGSEDPDNLSLARLGVFRKLAPLTYQDQLKHAMVARATGNFDSADNIYGFAPASTTVHDYEVTDGTTSINLSDFANHLKPLTENFEDDAEYQEALESWEASDDGRWANLWAYVPMFSREDVKAFIEPVDEPGQTTNPNPIEVAIPHLARTYEVASALSFILSPYQEDRSPVEPNLASQWINPAPWTTDPSWLDSDDSQPGNWDDLGSVCDPQQTVITSSGDLAHDERSNTQTFKTVQMDNPFYDPDCAVEYPDPLNPDIILIDDSACFVDQTVRFSPTYLKTYTPFLHAIMDQLLTGPNAVFNIFKPYSQIADEDIENWPAAGNESEENLAYTFSGGQAEAGNREDPSKAQYYFKYLGTLHCQKEKLIAGLQPFLGGVAEIDPQCTGGAPTPTPGGPIAGQGCFVFDKGAADRQGRVGADWSSDPTGKANVEMAISLVLQSPTWANLVCNGGPVKLYRIHDNYGGGQAISGAQQIFLYNGGASNPGTAIYTLAHETGHIVDTWSPLFSQFMSQGIISRDGGYLESYPNAKSDHEDFAETAGLYVGIKYYCNPR